MSIGQEGDTRRYRKLRKDDYYATKSAFETPNQHTSRSPTEWPRCSVCGQECRGVTFGVPPDDVTCLRCHNEKVTE
jgi:hypothetical protein